MKHKTILFIGTGQIGKAILNKMLLSNPQKIIIHNLTEEESIFICNKFKKSILILNLYQVMVIFLCHIV